MRKACIDHAVALANAGKTPSSKIAKESVEVGVLVPSLLLASLEKAGFEVEYFSGPEADAKSGKAKHGAWCKVFGKGDVIVAQAYSHDEKDALLQAVYAWMREEDAALANKSEEKASKK